MALVPVKVDLSTKTCVVTGASSGIGRQVAQNLAAMGATVIVTSPGLDRADAARAEIVAATQSRRVSAMKLDHSNRLSLREFAETFAERHEHLHILVHSAATWSPVREQTEDAIEKTWMVNVLGPHILNRLLTDRLKASSPARIVHLACNDAGDLEIEDTDFDQRRYDGWAAFRQSQQAVRMLSASLAPRMAIHGVQVHLSIPGSAVRTNLHRNARGLRRLRLGLAARLFGTTAAAAADGPTWLAASPDVGPGGKLWLGRKESQRRFRDAAKIQLLWDSVERQANGLMSKPGLGQSGMFRLPM
ncbi:MAG: SDR family NAD(P)-dependent oxidoreductase [Myxococcales bacterium]|nr:SDR family NAD(P)-dependent oxidoreductase [Myxococcales bacterium]